jgi:hypothetical protein
VATVNRIARCTFWRDAKDASPDDGVSKLSQEKLAQALGIGFQQAQKYQPKIPD